jgi:hypothetical protein
LTDDTDAAARPPLPAAQLPRLDALAPWFSFIADLPRDAELFWDGALLDGLFVTDAPSARRALSGYRWVREDGRWVDAVNRERWRKSWIVLDSMDGDPLIADVDAPGAPMFTSRHGEGSWVLQPAASDLLAFIDGLLVAESVPGPPGDEVTFDWSVRVVGLGADPKRTMLRLRDWPLFPGRSHAELIRVADRLPVTVVEDVTETVARNMVDWASAQGIPAEAVRG